MSMRVLVGQSAWITFNGCRLKSSPLWLLPQSGRFSRGGCLFSRAAFRAVGGAWRAHLDGTVTAAWFIGSIGVMWVATPAASLGRPVWPPRCQTGESYRNQRASQPDVAENRHQSAVHSASAIMKR